jgi:hypothetical protein
MGVDPVAQLLSDPRFKGLPITWEVTSKGYDAIRRAWLTHVHAEEVLFKPFTEDEFKAQIQIMLSVFTDDCVMELVPAGKRWEGHAQVAEFYRVFLSSLQGMQWGSAGTGHRPPRCPRRGEYDREAGQGVRWSERSRRAGAPSMGDPLPVGAACREVQGRSDLFDPPAVIAVHTTRGAGPALQ